MAVETWEPNSVNDQISAQELTRLLEAAELLDKSNFGLAESEISILARCSRHPDVDWVNASENLEGQELVKLLRLFTLAEGVLQGWEAGSKSPVIVIASELKTRGLYPTDLTKWIKENTANRFLPYGDIMDRL